MDSDEEIVLGATPERFLSDREAAEHDRAVDEARDRFWAEVRLHDERRHRISNKRARAYGSPQFDSILPPIITPRIPDPEATLPPGATIPPLFPPDKILTRYPSRNAALYHLESTAVELGFALVKDSSLKAKNGRVWQKFHCHMGPTRGQGANAESYADEEPCPFYFYVVNNGPGFWFTATPVNPEHSHPACRPLGTPAILRVHLRLHEQWLRNCVELRRPPREVMAILQERKIPFNKKAVYRRLDKLKAKMRPELYSRFPTQAALKELEEHDDISVPWIDPHGRLEGLLFASKQARALSQLFHKVFMVDFTFKTNAYNMPLLHIVGKTNTNSTFTSATILLPSQSEAAVSEALLAWKEHVLLSASPGVFVTDREKSIVNAIKRVFPDAAHISCRWHVKKNVHKTALSAGNLEIEDADELVEAWEIHVAGCKIGTAEAVAEGHNWLKRSFSNRPGKFGFKKTMHYCRVTLAGLEPLFVEGYINKLTHLGNPTSSPAEGSHAAMKRWFNGSRPNFVDFLDSVRKYMDSQYMTWSSEMALTASKAARHRIDHLRQVSGGLVRKVEVEEVEADVMQLVRPFDQSICSSCR